MILPVFIFIEARFKKLEKRWGDEKADGELLCLLTFFHPALVSAFRAGGAMSYGEDVNWDWNNKQSEPIWHLQKTEEEAAECTRIRAVVFGLDLAPCTTDYGICRAAKVYSLYTHILLRMYIL